ncbi:fimbria/pilus periplasmic chaperone [Burkholderia territorii]|uniref:fimbrial biogenesis chaperone n=1 Tax=Burkholderia territorii TaxID=1503055 RepID=UPI0007BA75C8
MKWTKSKGLAALACCAVLWAHCVQASVVITGTRVLFPGDSREVTVRLLNDGKTPVLVQTWLDTGDEKSAPEKIAVPFVLTPSMFRLDPAKGQSLRILYTGEPLPADRESLFWLNVLEVPPKADGNEGANKVQLAFRTRIKVMFRPAGLPGEAGAAAEQMRWEVVPGQGSRGVALKASNPTPYVVNLGELAFEAAGRKYTLKPGFVRPQDVTLFPVPGLSTVPADGTVQSSRIDDWGVVRPVKPFHIGGSAHD